MNIWALIPSRKGSVRLKNKAVLHLAGKPLVQYTFEAALGSPSLSKRWVFSNDEAVLALAKENGLDVPHFPRPEALSASTTSSWDTVRYFLQQFPQKQWPDWLVLLQPTSPLRTSDHIEAALAYLLARQADGVEGLISVCQPSKPVEWLLHCDATNTLQGKLLSQPLKTPVVYPNGALYIYKPTAIANGWVDKSPVSLKGRVVAYPMAQEASLDVDTAYDLALAETVLNHQTACTHLTLAYLSSAEPATRFIKL